MFKNENVFVDKQREELEQMKMLGLPCSLACGDWEDKTPVSCFNTYKNVEVFFYVCIGCTKLFSHFASNHGFQNSFSFTPPLAEYEHCFC